MSMISFAVIGHCATTDSGFTLNDMPGSAGRMDLLARCVAASLLLSHGCRKDAECRLVLCGGPDGPKTVLFRGAQVRSLSPDERSAGALIKKALSIPCGDRYREWGPGVYIRRGGLSALLAEMPHAVLDEKGPDLSLSGSMPPAFLLSDHLDFTQDEEALLTGLPRFSIGPLIIQADQAIAVTHNILDRKEAGWE
jgi:tRNA (pseudouridine54-N1)-methyltransferase